MFLVAKILSPLAMEGESRCSLERKRGNGKVCHVYLQLL